MSLTIALPIACVLENTALADEGETRFSLQVGGSFAELNAFEASGSNALYGGALAVAQGFRNWLDAGVAVGFHRRGDAVIDDAILDGVGGTPVGTYRLFTDVQTFSAATTIRAYLEVGPFLRLRPLVGVRVGGEATQFASPQLFAGNTPSSAVGDNKWEFAPLGGAEVGIAYRLTDSFEGAVLLSAESSSVQTNFGLTLEVSWQRL